MVLLVSALFSLCFHQVAVDRHTDSIPFLFPERGGHGLGAPRLRPKSKAQEAAEGLQPLHEREASGGERAEAEG